MSTLNMGSRRGEFVVSEFDPNYCRRTVTVKSGQILKACTVVAMLLAAGAAVAVGSPTGTGTITIGAALGAKAMPGAYRLRCTAASSGAGTFHLIDPTGKQVRMNTATGAITVGGGATTSDHFTVTIADGTPDFAAGDEWTVTVAEGGVEILDPAEDDGAQIAAGILYDDVDASAGDTPGVIQFRGPAIANAAYLVWPNGISDANKALAIASLAAAGIAVQ